MTTPTITFGTFGVIPTFGIAGAGKRTLEEFAPYAERLGYDAFFFPDHPSNYWGPEYDPLIRMAWAAAVTTRIKIGSLVTILPCHQPVRLAQMVTTLDHLSHGRVILGVGAGGEYPKQFEAFGIAWSQRGRRTDEYIQIMIGLWTNERFTFRGQYFEFEGISQEPRPVQTPHPPIWVGGRPGGVTKGPDGKEHFKSRTAAAVRAGRYGQCWVPYSVTVDQVKTTTELVRQVAVESGRDPDKIQIALNNTCLVRESYEEALRDATANSFRYGRDISKRVHEYDLLGTPNDIIKRMEQYIDVGVTHFQLGGPSGQLEIAAKEIIPYFREPARLQRRAGLAEAP